MARVNVTRRLQRLKSVEKLVGSDSRMAGKDLGDRFLKRRDQPAITGRLVEFAERLGGELNYAVSRWLWEAGAFPSSTAKTIAL
jgi:hypothetical protein